MKPIDKERVADFAGLGVDWLWESDADDRVTWFSMARAESVNLEPIAALEDRVVRREPFRDVLLCLDSVTPDLHWCLASGQPYHDSAGTFVGYRGVGRDVVQQQMIDKTKAALLSTIISNVDCGIAVYDKDTRLAAWNDRLPGMVGIDPTLLRPGVAARDLLISQGLSGEFGPVDPEVEADRRLTTFWHEHPVISERRRPNGKIVEFRRNPVPGGGSVTIYIDVTARRQVEQQLQESNTTLEARIAERTVALAESERFQRTIIASVPGMVYRCKKRGTWVLEFASEGSRKLLGFAPEQLVGGRVTYDDLIHPDDREQMRQKWREDLAAGRTFELEYRVRHSDGSWRWVLDRAQGARDDSGEVVLLEGLVLDMTAREEAKRDLARARDNLIDAVDSIDHNLVLHDRDDRLVLFTRHIREQYPKASEHFVIGRGFEEILRDILDSGALPVPPGQTKEQFIARRAAERKRADGTVYERHLPDGRILNISDHPAPSGGVVTVGLDVTERLKFEARMRDVHRLDAIGRLAGGVAHDLNNYLAVIMGNLDLLAEHEHRDPEIAKLVEAATGGALRGAELTRSLLAFSRLQPLDPQVLDIGARLAATAKLLEPVIGRKIAVDLDIATNLWPVRIDAAQLDTCIVNITNNARDAMPDGGRLSISARNGDPSSDRVLIEFRDTGLGMDTDTTAQAFEPFFTTKDTGHGTGLGLSMVHGFVHQSGGEIHIVSEPGKGTTVRISLPRSSEAAASVAVGPRAAALPRGSERILVVEDNEQVRAAAVQQLVSLGYTVVHADNGTAALAVLENGNADFDLVFTDLMMPGSLDGNELALLVLERWPGVRVLLTSGFSDDPSPQGSRRFETLHKPYRKAELAHAIRAALAA